jgi:UDP-N-acetylmuramyl tripeptide synthase
MFRFDIKTLRALRGPNRYSRHKAVFMLLDILKYESKYSNSIPSFAEKIIEYLPSLADTKTLIHEKDFFLKRLKNGASIPDVILNVAIELQALAGFSVEKGNVVKTKEKGIYVIVFNYIEEEVGLDAAEEAVILVEYIVNNKKYSIDPVIQELKKTGEHVRLNPAVQCIVDDATEQGIPLIRLDKKNYVQLGYGKYQQKIDFSTSSKFSTLPVESTIEMLFPPGAKTSVPIVAVTGTNGKTTVCKLIAHALKYSGSKVGLASTTGVEIDGMPIAQGDYSGPSGHELVLCDDTVDYAVLETARGGILRRGLAYSECDIAVFLNVGKDHIGNDLIESIEDLGELKATLVKSVKDTGFSILNADDNIVMQYKEEAGGHNILFSLNPHNKHIQKHTEKGGISVLASNNNIILRAKGRDEIIVGIVEVPITFGGTADFNISNTLAAVSVLYGLGLKRAKIRDGITTFYPSITLNPGRMNIFDFNTFKVILDYGHNKHAMDALSRMLPKFSKGRKIGICHGSGNRKDELLKEFAAIMAKAYDYIIVTDLDIRQRELGETAEVVHRGILDAGFDEKSVEIILDVHDAIDEAFNIVRDDDVIVIQVDKIQPVIDHVLSKKADCV